MFERFTHEAREVVIGAQTHARQMKHRHIGTEHVLLALLDPASGVPAAILTGAGLRPASVQAAIEKFMGAAEYRLGESDAEALESIGIDLDAVKRKLEETFGPGALEPWFFEERRRGIFGRRRLRPVGGGHIPFTPRAKKVLELSLREALRFKHKHIASEHILLGLTREGEGLAAKIMAEAGVDLGEVRRQAEGSLRRAA